jgi:hypothetical protein
LTRWCAAQPDLIPYRGNCLVHRAEILTFHGAWPEAYDEAERARTWLADTAGPSFGNAYYQARRAAPAARRVHRRRGGVQASQPARTRDPTRPRAAAPRAGSYRLRDRGDPPRARRDDRPRRAGPPARRAGRDRARRRAGGCGPRCRRRARRDRRRAHRPAVACDGEVRRRLGDAGRGRRGDVTRAACARRGRSGRSSRRRTTARGCAS